MKKDRLERFIRDNREAFDAHEPSPDLWARLDQRLGSDVVPLNGHAPSPKNPVPLDNPRISFWRGQLWWKAACAVLVVGLAGWWMLSPQTPKADTEMARINPQAAQTAFHYTSLIELKRTEIRQVAQEDPQLYQEFSSEIEGLDRDYQHLKAELPQTPNQEELLRAMIENLQRQVDILNRQLSVLHRINNAKKQHEPLI